MLKITKKTIFITEKHRNTLEGHQYLVLYTDDAFDINILEKPFLFHSSDSVALHERFLDEYHNLRNTFENFVLPS